jgi:hypothetical protein
MLLATRVVAQIGLLASVFSLAVAPYAAAQAPEYEAPANCTNCHDPATGRDHSKQLEWSEKYDGGPGNKQHRNALTQLRAPQFKDKFDKYAKAIGITAPAKDAYCLNCHATVVDGRPAGGVTCQRCHGPGTRYLKPHQQEGSYQMAVGLGMLEIIKKPETWIPNCLNCHILGDTPDKDNAIIAAGHPSGSDFDLGAKVKYVSGPGHWSSLINTKTPRSYLEAEINNLAAKGKKDRLARLTATPPPATATGPPSTPPSPATPAPPPVGPNQPTAVAGSPAPPPVEPPSGTPNQPTAQVSTGTPPKRTAAPAQGGNAPPTPAPSVPRAAVVPPAPAPPLPVMRPPSALPAAPVAPRDPATLTPAGVVASIQGRLATLLESLLAKGVTLPKPPDPPPTTYRGADAELLRLQNEAITLALRALSTPPPKEQSKP